MHAKTPEKSRQNTLDIHKHFLRKGKGSKTLPKYHAFPNALNVQGATLDPTFVPKMQDNAKEHGMSCKPTRIKFVGSKAQPVEDDDKMNAINSEEISWVPSHTILPHKPRCIYAMR
jgi:hypothetical protein